MLGCLCLSQFTSDCGRSAAASGGRPDAVRPTPHTPARGYISHGGGSGSRPVRSHRAGKEPPLLTERKTGRTRSSRTLECDVNLLLGTVSKRLQEQFLEFSFLVVDFSEAREHRTEGLLWMHANGQNTWTSVSLHVFIRYLPSSLSRFFPGP